MTTTSSAPPNLDEARASLASSFGIPANVTTGVSAGDWVLFVVTDDLDLKLPETHAGYRVLRRCIRSKAP